MYDTYYLGIRLDAALKNIQEGMCPRAVIVSSGQYSTLTNADNGGISNMTKKSVMAPGSE